MLADRLRLVVMIMAVTITVPFFPPGKLYMAWLMVVVMIVTNNVLADRLYVTWLVGSRRQSLTLCCLTFPPGKLYVTWLFVVMIVTNTVLSYLSPRQAVHGV